jgi:DNA-binding response OmpR family regulator
VHILLATDADWIVDEITAALSGPDTSFTVCREGRVVVDVVAEREPDLAILDLQVGSKGGMAVTMALRLDESAGMLPHVPVIMLLDRRADVFLARRCGAEGWLIKPLDPLRIKRAVAAVMAGDTYFEGIAVPTSDVPEAEIGDGEDVSEPATPEEDELASSTIETEDELASSTIETGEPAPAG